MELAKIRNNNTFHYGPRVLAKNPLVRQALRAVASEPGTISVSEASGTFRFASEVAAAIFTISCGGNEPGAEEIGVLLGEVAGASIDFHVFAHEAIKHFLDRSGVAIQVTANS